MNYLSLFLLSLVLHISAGFTALLLFWIPIVTKKGGKLHNRVGWIYVAAMGIVSITGAHLSITRIVTGGTDIAFSWFLLFISILSGTSAWYGVRVLKFKGRKTRHKKAIDLFASSLLLFSSIGISLFGITIGDPLLTWFPLLGLFLGSIQLSYWLRRPKEKFGWWFEHIGAMIGSCIATVTAFTVFAAPRLLNIEAVSLFLWFLPTILLMPVIIGFTTYYKKKFS